MTEFQINDYITLKLEEGKTIIYLDGRKFAQCKQLMLDLKTDQVELYDEIRSIDEAEEIYQKIAKDGKIYETYNRHNKVDAENYELTPEQEFWGHCSNLQVWDENNYNTDILHSNLSFPLLYGLTQLGDLKAKKVFKDEIAKKFEYGNENNKIFLITDGYLTTLSEDEFWTLFNPNDAEAIKDLEKILKKKIELVATPYENYPPEFWCETRKDEYRIIGISIENSNLSELPNSIGDIVFLESLYLSRNQIKNVPDSIGKLTNLKYLYMDSNKINKIPESIGKLESLEVFKLMSNEIDSIPESIEFLKKLETLNLAANKLKSLPIESISKLTSLRNLSISYNPLNPGEHFKLKKKLREKKGVLH